MIQYTIHDTYLHGYAAVIIRGNLIDSSGCLSTLPCIDKCMIRDRCCVIRGPWGVTRGVCCVRLTRGACFVMRDALYVMRGDT